MTSAEIVEKIKRVLLDPEGSTQGALAKLASEYASHCRRLNANVERAISLVRSGALSEAKRALDEYSVFEEFRILNVDGKEDWRAVCRTLAFEVAILPPVQTLEELRAFNAVYERTSELFTEQRRLALEGGSNARRLQILYALESTFPQYSFWKAIVKELERERVLEIANRLKTTTKQNVDVGFITDALQELEDAKRHKRAPEELLNNLRLWKEYADASSLLKRLRVLLEEWKKARDSNDDFQALACLKYFRDEELSKATTLATKEEQELLDDLIQQTQKIERRETARVQLKRKSRELSRALETDSNADRLTDLYASTELESDKAGEALDPSVTRAYKRRIETLETQSRRKRLAFILLISITLALFGAASTLVVKRAQTKRDVDGAIAELTSKLQDYEGSDGTVGRVEALEEAEALVKNNEKRRANFLDDSGYLQAVDRVKNARVQEDRRLRQFEDVATKILSAHKERRPTPSLLDKLRDRCRTERERKVYLKLKQQDVELKNKEDANNSEVYAQKLDDLVAVEKILEDAQNLTENERKLEISKIRRALDELKQFESKTDVPELQTQIKAREALGARLDDFERRTSQTNKDEETQASETSAESEPTESDEQEPTKSIPKEPAESESSAESSVEENSTEESEALEDVLKMLDE